MKSRPGSGSENQIQAILSELASFSLVRRQMWFGIHDL